MASTDNLSSFNILQNNIPAEHVFRGGVGSGLNEYEKMYSIFRSESYNDNFADDPTYLGFKIEFGCWGASFGIFEGTKRYNRAIFMEDYNDYPMGLLRYPDPNNLNSKGKDSSSQNYSAIQWLYDRNEDMRAQYLKSFIDGLNNLQTVHPYVFESISGVGGLLKVDTTKGMRLAQPTEITINCYESIDLRIKTLLNLYKQAAWDSLYQRWSLPSNMREFKMIIYISDIRRFGEVARKGKKPVTYNEYNLNGDGFSTHLAESRYKYSGQDDTTMDMAPVLAIECSPCEFVIDDPYGGDSYKQTAQGASAEQTSIKIRVKNCKVYMRNSVLKILLKNVSMISDMISRQSRKSGIVTGELLGIEPWLSREFFNNNNIMTNDLMDPHLSHMKDKLWRENSIHHVMTDGILNVMGDMSMLGRFALSEDYNNGYNNSYGGGSSALARILNDKLKKLVKKGTNKIIDALGLSMSDAFKKGMRNILDYFMNPNMFLSLEDYDVQRLTDTRRFEDLYGVRKLDETMRGLSYAQQELKKNLKQGINELINTGLVDTENNEYFDVNGIRISGVKNTEEINKIEINGDDNKNELPDLKLNGTENESAINDVKLNGIDNTNELCDTNLSGIDNDNTLTEIELKGDDIVNEINDIDLGDTDNDSKLGNVDLGDTDNGSQMGDVDLEDTDNDSKLGNVDLGDTDNDSKLGNVDLGDTDNDSKLGNVDLDGTNNSSEVKDFSLQGDKISKPIESFFVDGAENKEPIGNVNLNGVVSDEKIANKKLYDMGVIGNVNNIQLQGEDNRHDMFGNIELSSNNTNINLNGVNIDDDRQPDKLSDVTLEESIKKVRIENVSLIVEKVNEAMKKVELINSGDKLTDELVKVNILMDLKDMVNKELSTLKGGLIDDEDIKSSLQPVKLDEPTAQKSSFDKDGFYRPSFSSVTQGKFEDIDPEVIFAQTGKRVSSLENNGQSDIRKNTLN